MVSQDELTQRFALSSAPGIGAATYRQLIESLGSVPEVLAASEKTLIEVPGIGKVRARSVLAASHNLGAAKIQMDALSERKVAILYSDFEHYPKNLKLLPNPPPLLFTLGSLNILRSRGVAIVGARAASREGLAAAHQLAGALCEIGYSIISGYAHGIDESAHRGALDAGDQTVAVVPEGLLEFRPRSWHRPHNAWTEQILVVSDAPPAATRTTGLLMARNQLVVALSEAVVIVECSESGGTMETASMARELKKRLLVWEGAIGPAPSGNRALIEDGADTFSSVENLLSIIDKP